MSWSPLYYFSFTTQYENLCMKLIRDLKNAKNTFKDFGMKEKNGYQRKSLRKFISPFKHFHFCFFFLVNRCGTTGLLMDILDFYRILFHRPTPPKSVASWIQTYVALWKWTVETTNGVVMLQFLLWIQFAYVRCFVLYLPTFPHRRWWFLMSGTVKENIFKFGKFQ